ncbi:MAG: FAD binding domain-containing protein [Xanthomonadales bacterium]|nr:FAD binding domain-containing protein [Xanthomonadales bacterium]
MNKQRDFVLVYINGQRREIRGPQAFLTLSDYLRSELQLRGTKVVCAEGDCGACTVLAGPVTADMKISDVDYRAINACIVLMHSLDCSQIISIEGLNQIYPESLHPVQQSMLDCHGSQCGFCTPGIVMAVAGMLEVPAKLTEKNARNYLTGNLCRCTGYQQIIDAVVNTDISDYKAAKTHFHSDSIHADLLTAAQTPVSLHYKDNSFIAATDVFATLDCLQSQQEKADAPQIFAAATDLGVQISKGHIAQQNALSLHLLPALYEFKVTSQHCSIGARVTLTQLRNSIKQQQPEFSAFLNIFASPQIKNNATLVGNIANGSPIGDTLPFLMVMDAIVVIQGPQGIRRCNINKLYSGYRQLELAATEIITHVEIPHKPDHTELKLYKVSQRRDLDISCVSAAFKVQFDQHHILIDAAIAYGGVAATVYRLTAVEAMLKGLHRDEFFSQDKCDEIAASIRNSLNPLSDVRGSDNFRNALIENLYKKFIHELKTEQIAGVCNEN